MTSCIFCWHDPSIHLPHPSSQLLPVPTTEGLLHPDHWLCIPLAPLPLDVSRTWFSSAHLLKLLPWRSALPDSSGPPVPWLHCFIFSGHGTTKPLFCLGFPLHCFHKCPRHMYTVLPCSVSFSLTTTLGSSYLPIFRGGHRGSVTSHDLPRLLGEEEVGLGFKPGTLKRRAHTPNHYGSLPSFLSES